MTIRTRRRHAHASPALRGRARRRTAGAVTVAVVAAVPAAAAVAAGETGSWSAGAVVLAVVVVAAAAVWLVRSGPESLAAALLTAGVATTPWNAVVLGGIKPAPAFLAGALAVLTVLALVDRRPVPVPLWVWPLGVAILLAVALHLLVPTEPGYLASRFVPDTRLSAAQLAAADLSGAVAGFQWAVAAVALPVTVCMAAVRRPGTSGRLADAWVVGSTVSAAVAVLDRTGLTAVSAALLPVVDVGGRQSGLSVQPNHLAVAIALTAPFTLWRILRGSGTARTLMAGCLAVQAAGLLVSGSRGGLVVAVLACVVVALADRRARAAVPLVGGLAVAALLLVAVGAPDLLARLGTTLRLGGTDSATASDVIREGILAQAVTDVLHDPLRGVGLEVAVQGHNIFLQLLAAGGVLTLAGFLLTQAGFLADGWSLRARTDGLSAALALCGATWLVAGLVENHLTDLFLYVPMAAMAGLHARAATASFPPSAETTTNGSPRP